MAPDQERITPPRITSAELVALHGWRTPFAPEAASVITYAIPAYAVICYRRHVPLSSQGRV